jgi:CubicO group peptidase (beta-lactamase class C family)
MARQIAGEGSSMDLQPIIEAARENIRTVMERDGVPGVSVALIDNGQPVWAESFGLTDVGDKGRPIAPDTIFSLQSISKNFTATAVMLAVQRGLLDLDRPIIDYLPDFTVHSRHERDPQSRMTLRHLLSHRAGFTHEAPIGGNWEPTFATYDAPDFDAHIASISDTWLRYPVGDRYAYSNLGIDLAGQILARALGTSFATALKTLVFVPLGMTSSTADPDIYAAEGNRAIGHQPGFDRVAVKIPMQPSGGVYSSVADMTRYALFHLGRGVLDGETILKRELWDEMHTPTFPGMPYALGVIETKRERERGTTRRLNHNGGGFGFGSVLSYCPDQALAWVVLFNGQTRIGPPVLYEEAWAEAVLESRFGPVVATSAPADPPVELPREVLQPYVGSYVEGVSYLTVAWAGEALALRMPGEAALSRLVFTGEHTAYVAEGPKASHRLTLHPAEGVKSAWIEFADPEGSGAAGGYFDFNDSDREPPGDVGDRYDELVGPYEVIQWGQPVFQLSIEKKNGCIHIGGMRMTEHLPGLFFSSAGEALDLRGATPTMRNILLHRRATDPA